MDYQVHETAIVDEGAQIGSGSRVWQWVHVCAGAKIGSGVSLGQNVFVGNKVIIGDKCKIQNNVSVYGFGHPLYYNNVIEVLRGKSEPETDGREGLKSLEILIAAYLSARDGTTTSLPLEY